MNIRVKFKKYGSMKFVGHLDLMRYFQKAVRRAGIDICYTQGFHPHPVMSFALPLGVGMISDGEYMDIEVNSTLPTKEAVALLNSQMAEGIEVVNYVRLEEHAKKAMALVTGAAYSYILRDDAQYHPNLQTLQKKIYAYYELQDHLLVTKTTKKNERELDLKPLIYRMESIAGRSENDTASAGIYLLLSAGSTDNIKPELVLEDFYKYLGEVFDPCDYIRKRIDVYTGEPGSFVGLDALGEVIE